MKSNELRLFLRAVAADPALQAQCGAAKHLAQLVQLAQAAGFAITAKDLQLWAHDEAFPPPTGRGQKAARRSARRFFVASPDDTRQGAELGHTDYSHGYVE